MTIVDLSAYRKKNSVAVVDKFADATQKPAEPKASRRRRKSEDASPRWRPMTDDERNVAITLVSTMTTLGVQPDVSTNAISFMLDMAKKAMIEPDAQVTQKQIDWLWVLADKYGLLEEASA